MVLAIIAISAAPLLVLYGWLCRRTNAAHLHILLASDARQTVDRMPWKRLERLQLLVGALFVMFLPTMFLMRHIAGDAWSNIDSASFWSIGIALTAFVILSQHYEIEDLIVSIGGGRRAASVA
jgi:hypothetical protein